MMQPYRAHCPPANSMRNICLYNCKGPGAVRVGRYPRYPKIILGTLGSSLSKRPLILASFSSLSSCRREKSCQCSEWRERKGGREEGGREEETEGERERKREREGRRERGREERKKKRKSKMRPPEPLWLSSSTWQNWGTESAQGAFPPGWTF